MFSSYDEYDVDDDDLPSVPTLDLSWLGALHHLRKLDLQGLSRGSEHANFNLLQLGGGGSRSTPDASGSGSGAGAGSARSASRSLPPRLEELLLPRAIQLDGPSMHALAGLRHLTHLSLTLNDTVCGALRARPLAPLAATLRQLELWVEDLLGHEANMECTLPVVAGLLAANPPAALRLTLEVKGGSGVDTAELVLLRGIVESVREVQLLSITFYDLSLLQVSWWAGGGPMREQIEQRWWLSCWRFACTHLSDVHRRHLGARHLPRYALPSAHWLLGSAGGMHPRRSQHAVPAAHFRRQAATPQQGTLARR